ncbi:adenosylmethionine--8-amino-7-oxononanoate transaminase [Telmatospirillum sp.]|uniref:adenosylmethionine--8-amino-7-oxononanoate transaminase n=1 Tax=Telmatospirillum sp. TaxID=2079197 RepID=UPI00284AB4E5|nr:adenosylmethionine--8-amino-7-oxononanoate transaminase [Telmatospirillum sp.]MDR3437242.1 adenosylmethionine--8-amino-7-oxononanoate transaminase [Telmatospirillum sp.]
MSDSTRDPDVLELDRRHVWHPYTQEQTAPVPLVAVAGKGARIVLDDGRELIDLVSSWWVNLHGHGHPAIAAAVAAQAARLEQVIFADFTHAPAARLAARLADLLPGKLDRVFYSDNGSTAVEVALKVALQYFANRGDVGRRHLLAFQGGYHGDTVGAMSVGKSSGYFRAWEELLFPVDMLPFPATWIGDEAIEAKETEAFAALDAALSDGVAAVIIEPLIQGASGMRMCRPEFLQGLASRVKNAGALLIFDEVMTGFGRTGALFACLKAGVEPDMVCLSKGLTGGFLPMGATVVREEIHQAFLSESLSQAFLHGHSYTANPLGCAAGLASLDLLLGADCQAQRAGIEAIHRERLQALSLRPKVLRPRVTGTIAALDLDDSGYASAQGPRLRELFLERGFLFRPLGPVAYFLPPYCLEAADLHRAWDTLEGALSRA